MEMDGSPRKRKQKDTEGNAKEMEGNPSPKEKISKDEEK